MSTIPETRISPTDGTVVRTSKTSSSCRYWSGSIATHHSSGVALSVPRTIPTCWLSAPTFSRSDIRLPELGLERPLQKPGITEPVPEDALELADGVEVLRCARIASDDRREAR